MKSDCRDPDGRCGHGRPTPRPASRRSRPVAVAQASEFLQVLFRGRSHELRGLVRNATDQGEPSQFSVRAGGDRTTYVTLITTPENGLQALLEVTAGNEHLAMEGGAGEEETGSGALQAVRKTIDTCLVCRYIVRRERGPAVRWASAGSPDPGLPSTGAGFSR